MPLKFNDRVNFQQKKHEKFNKWNRQGNHITKAKSSFCFSERGEFRIV